MFIELISKTTDDKESFDFILTKQRINIENKFLNLAQIVPKKVIKIIETNQIKTMGHASFQKNNEVFDSSYFFKYLEETAARYKLSI